MVNQKTFHPFILNSVPCMSYIHALSVRASGKSLTDEERSLAFWAEFYIVNGGKGILSSSSPSLGGAGVNCLIV